MIPRLSVGYSYRGLSYNWQPTDETWIPNTSPPFDRVGMAYTWPSMDDPWISEVN